jgi:hypothetical protein
MSQAQVLVGGISNTSVADGASPVALGGKAGDIIMSPLHGKAYTAAYRNRVFFGSSLIAGVTIPVNTTTAPTFTLYNPLGSNLVLELLTLSIGWPAANAPVVGTILGSVSTQTPTSVTQGGVIIPSPIGGGGVPQAKLYTAATIVAITSHIPLINLPVVTVPSGPAINDLSLLGLLIYPGGLITLTSTPVQTAACLPSISWAEFPI